MATTDKEKPSGKPRQRTQKGSQRGQKPEPQPIPKLDQRDDGRISQISQIGASTDAPTNGAAATTNGSLVCAAAPADKDNLSIGAAAPADDCPVSIQTIANAYMDYTRKSLQESRSFVERLMGVRSFDDAIAVQAEFAKQALANFVAESQKICELYAKLATPIFRPWEGLAAKGAQAGR
jgi:phasin family protein